MTYCATGFTTNNDQAQCEGSLGTVFCATFDSNLTSGALEHGVTFEGASPSSTPTPNYMRGLWFDGLDYYLSLSPLVINLEFTISAWIRVTSGDSIFTINGTNFDLPSNEDVLSFGIADGVFLRF